MRMIRNASIVMSLVAAVIAAGCGEDAADIPDTTALPGYPEDRLIEETGRPDRIVDDPTPQAGTSGPIPHYDPTEPINRDADSKIGPAE